MKTRVFIEVKKYRETLDAIDVIKSRLVVAKKLLSELHQLRAQENRELDQAKSSLAQIKDSLQQIDDEVFTS